MPTSLPNLLPPVVLGSSLLAPHLPLRHREACSWVSSAFGGFAYPHSITRTQGQLTDVGLSFRSDFEDSSLPFLLFTESCWRVAALSPTRPSELVGETAPGRKAPLLHQRKLAVAMDTESTYSGYSYYSSHSKKSHRQGYVSDQPLHPSM